MLGPIDDARSLFSLSSLALLLAHQTKEIDGSINERGCEALGFNAAPRWTTFLSSSFLCFLISSEGLNDKGRGGKSDGINLQPMLLTSQKEQRAECRNLEEISNMATN